jgi:hypothetical protein
VSTVGGGDLTDVKGEIILEKIERLNEFKAFGVK